jgi:hypothetical protein
MWFTTTNSQTGCMDRAYLEELRIRFEADLSGEADSRHICHLTNSSTIGMSQAKPVTVGDSVAERIRAMFSLGQTRLSTGWNSPTSLD